MDGSLMRDDGMFVLGNLCFRLIPWAWRRLVRFSVQADLMSFWKRFFYATDLSIFNLLVSLCMLSIRHVPLACDYCLKKLLLG